jgi:predicted site-specific integrase-resolvase
VTAVLAAPDGDDDEWLLRDEAMEELGITQSTFHRYARAGKFISFRVGNRSYTTRSSIEAYKRAVAAKAEAARIARERANRKR